jgi:hypothetical protein
MISCNSGRGGHISWFFLWNLSHLHLVPLSQSSGLQEWKHEKIICWVFSPTTKRNGGEVEEMVKCKSLCWSSKKGLSWRSEREAGKEAATAADEEDILQLKKESPKWLLQKK